MKDENNLMIYELLLRNFSTSGDVNGALQKLDYWESININAMELMPVQEFEENNS